VYDRGDPGEQAGARRGVIGEAATRASNSEEITSQEMAVDRQFWKGKRVLLTGHTGFKGSWLSCWLQFMGTELMGYALSPPAGPNLFSEARLDEGMVSVLGDVRDLDGVKRAVARHRPEILIHMAAQALVRRSHQDPVLTYSTNVMGSLNVLEAARAADDLRVVVMVTSDKCYANQERSCAYRESDTLGGRDPYSSSKACAELVVQAYRSSYFPPEQYASHGVAVATARAGNVIGGGDRSADRLVPDILRSLAENRPVMIRSPGATRPWQFVLEALAGYLRLAEKLWADGPAFAESWNFGPDLDDIRPVAWIADYLTRQWGEGARWVLDHGEHPREAHLLMLDCTKAKRLLGWRPRLELPTALDWVVEWNRAYLRGEPTRGGLEAQIRRYEALP
jgi:CDP-glucose 4,6-dehydratase